MVSAGDGNDLILSNAVCTGTVVDGGAGSDNASWAKFKDSGVEARLAEGIAGRPGDGTAPDCSGGTLDTVRGIEDLRALAGRRPLRRRWPQQPARPRRP